MLGLLDAGMSVSEAVRQCRITQNVVRYWRDRRQQGGNFNDLYNSHFN